MRPTRLTAALAACLLTLTLPLVPRLLANSNAAAMMGAPSVWQQGYTGQGVLVGVWDQLHIGDHTDLSGRVTTTLPFIPLPANWHSTHIAGTIAGDGSGDPSKQGIAPDARLISYANSTSGLADAAQRGIHIANNSWGYLNCAQSGGHYDYNAASYDNGSHTHNISLHFAAGNLQGCTADGYATLSNGGATAKNSLTIGAVGLDGSLLPHSSQGPTADGRLKPDLVALGVLYSTDVDGTGYSGMQGTSAATAAVSGATALLSEAYQAKYGRPPRPDIVKALLLHTASDQGRPGPDYSSGYGHIHIGRAINALGHLITGTVTATGWQQTLTATTPSEATLVWSDPAPSHPYDTPLVNDLNLTLIAPNGHTHYPLTLDPATPMAIAAPGIDHHNIVEQVQITTPYSGTWRVHISASLTLTPQAFALVISPHITTAPTAVTLQPRTAATATIPPFFSLLGLAIMVTTAVGLTTHTLYRRYS